MKSFSEKLQSPESLYSSVFQRIHFLVDLFRLKKISLVVVKKIDHKNVFLLPKRSKKIFSGKIQLRRAKTKKIIFVPINGANS